MDLLLNIVDPPTNLDTVTVVLRVDDQSEADAPARNLATHRFGPIDARDELVRLSLPFSASDWGQQRPALNLRIEATLSDGTVQTFVNTSEILLPSSDVEPVRADVFRI